jgi:opacity protein-like surface antigen
MRVLICAPVAVTSLPVLAWAGEAGPMPGSILNETLLLPDTAPTDLSNSWEGFYVNEGGDLSLSTGATSLLSGLIGPGGIDAAHSQTIGGMSSGAVGASWQTGGAVVGVQGDMQWADPAAAAITDCSLGCSLNNYARVPWLATLRARAGKDFDGLFVYGTGGFASFGAANNLNAGGFGSTPNPMNLPAGNIDWSIGGGMEMSLDKNVSAKIEYLHNTPTTFTGSLFDNDSKNDIVRGGIDYRLPVGNW